MLLHYYLLFIVIRVIISCFFILYIYIIIYKERTKKAEQGQSKRENRTGRENQGERFRRHLRQFLASLLFPLLPPPSTTSPAAHHFARLCQRSGIGTGGHLVRF